MKYDVIVVGGGMAGLTATAYLCRSGLKVLLCEKQEKVGGLVNSFKVDGFTFDGGIRAIESSGIVIPMLRQLKIDIPFISNGVSLGIEKEIINVDSRDSLDDYLQILNSLFPGNKVEIEKFGLKMKKIMRYMDVLYGIDNPLFLDFKENSRYMMQKILPWMPRFALTLNKINRLNKPAVDYLKQLSSNQSLIDMIAQHFFQDTPTFFALSYFGLYLDYQYPLGGTGQLTEQMKNYILKNNGEILCDTEICHLDSSNNRIQDTKGHSWDYKQLVWCADLKKLYQSTDMEIENSKIRQDVIDQKNNLIEKRGADSILTLYLTLNMDKKYFSQKSRAHFFYTPSREGLNSITSSMSEIMEKANSSSRTDIEDWLSQFFRLTTYEISCPVLRDATLAPEGKTGLIISTLFDYSLVRYITNMGWYEEFKELAARKIVDALSATVYPGIKEAIERSFVSTPLSIERMTGNSDGAITGWAFTNSSMPAVNNMAKVAKSVLTPIPDVYQAGQWTFSPSGLPISILTGKLAADKVIKSIK